MRDRLVSKGSNPAVALLGILAAAPSGWAEASDAAPSGKTPTLTNEVGQPESGAGSRPPLGRGLLGLGLLGLVCGLGPQFRKRPRAPTRPDAYTGKRRLHIRWLLPSVLVGALSAFVIAIPAHAADQGVDVGDDFFAPARVAVKSGESVTWTKPSTNAPHNLRFEDEGSARPGPATFAAWTTARTFGAEGSYRYYCDVHGGPGGAGMSGVVYVNSPGILPPVAAFQVSPNPAQVGQSVSFNGSASSATAPATITKHEWDLDGNGSFETDSRTTPTISRSYTSPATLTVKLRVTDSGGLTEEATRQLRINAPPTPSFTVSPNPARAGQTVTFTGSLGGDPDGSITRFEWDLDGNGSFETDTGPTRTASRSYAGAQTLTVALRVTDNDGASGETTRSLQIIPAPPTPWPQPGAQPQPDTSKPLLSALSFSPSRFRAAGSGLGIIASPVGSEVSYTLSEAAAVKFGAERALPGRRVGGRCAKPTRSNRGAKPCTRYETLAGSFTHPGNAGANSFTFRGRLGGRKLSAGRYRLRAAATDLTGNKSDPKRSRFRIVRR